MVTDKSEDENVYYEPEEISSTSDERVQYKEGWQSSEGKRKRTLREKHKLERIAEVAEQRKQENSDSEPARITRPKRPRGANGKYSNLNMHIESTFS